MACFWWKQFFAVFLDCIIAVIDTCYQGIPTVTVIGLINCLLHMLLLPTDSFVINSFLKNRHSEVEGERKGKLNALFRAFKAWGSNVLTQISPKRSCQLLAHHLQYWLTSIFPTCSIYRSESHPPLMPTPLSKRRGQCLSCKIYWELTPTIYASIP